MIFDIDVCNWYRWKNDKTILSGTLVSFPITFSCLSRVTSRNCCICVHSGCPRKWIFLNKVSIFTKKKSSSFMHAGFVHEIHVTYFAFSLELCLNFVIRFGFLWATTECLEIDIRVIECSGLFWFIVKHKRLTGLLFILLVFLGFRCLRWTSHGIWFHIFTDLAEFRLDIIFEFSFLFWRHLNGAWLFVLSEVFQSHRLFSSGWSGWCPTIDCLQN